MADTSVRLLRLAVAAAVAAIVGRLPQPVARALLVRPRRPALEESG